MNKADIVDVLERIAVLLELKGENPFKIRAYAAGARALENLETDLGEVIAAGRLGAVKGIGSALVDKIEALHVTGELDYYTELQAWIAPGLIEMLEIPGWGAKRSKNFMMRWGSIPSRNYRRFVRRDKLPPEALAPSRRRKS